MLRALGTHAAAIVCMIIYHIALTRMLRKGGLRLLGYCQVPKTYPDYNLGFMRPITAASDVGTEGQRCSGAAFWAG